MATIRDHFEQSFEHTVRVDKVLSATGPAGEVRLHVRTHLDFDARAVFASVFIPSSSQDAVTAIIQALVLDSNSLLVLSGGTNVTLPRLDPVPTGAEIEVVNDKGALRLTSQAADHLALGHEDLVFTRNIYFYSENEISQERQAYLSSLARAQQLTISFRGPTYAGAREPVGSSFQKLQAQWPMWAWLRDRLRSSGLDPTSARELATNDALSSWVILAKPSEHLQQHFDLDAEILILCAPGAVLDPDDIKRVETLFAHEPRVDPGFALVITADPAAATRLAPVQPDDRQYLCVRDDAFRTAPDPQAFLLAILRDGLGRRRLFDFRLPAGEWQFFGRGKELEALERDVLGGHCLGVFGLRKVGKTSLLRRLADKFRKGDVRRVVPVEVDLLATSYLRRNLDGVAELIGKALDRELTQAHIQVPAPAPHPLERLRAAVEHLEQALGARVLLILDEYEVLLGGRIPPTDGVELLTWLRGLAQAHPRAFGFVLAGRNQKLLAPARIGDTDNPMYRFLRSVPVAGLVPDDCAEMIRALGGRLGLRFEPEAIDLIVRETGGHPSLARTLGDTVDAHVPTSERNPAVIDAAVVRRVLPRFSREVDQDMRECLNAANDIDARAGDYLVHLTYDVPWIGGPTEARIDDALVGYGILHPDTHTFRIDRLSLWLRETHESPAEVAHG